jgi:hypothetical protein
MFERENGSSLRGNASPDDAPTDRAPGESDPFADLESLRLTQDFVAHNGVKPLLSSVAVRKPNRQEFIRVRPGDEWQFEAGCLTENSTKDIYLVHASLVDELRGDVKATCLRASISRGSKTPFLWPIGLPGPGGQWNSWHESAATAASLAEGNWLKVTSDGNANTYRTHVAEATFPEPEWPVELSMNSLIRVAFKDRIIDSIDHRVLRRLRGEI